MEAHLFSVFKRLQTKHSQLSLNLPELAGWKSPVCFCTLASFTHTFPSIYSIFAKLFLFLPHLFSHFLKENISPKTQPAPPLRFLPSSLHLSPFPTHFNTLEQWVQPPKPNSVPAFCVFCHLHPHPLSTLSTTEGPGLFGGLWL